MTDRWQSTWNALTPGRRSAVGAIALLIGTGLYITFVQAMDANRSRLRASVTAMRVDVARLERNAAEIARLRSAAVTPAPQRDLRAAVEASARSAGASQARIDVKAADQVGVVVGSIPFASWLAWVADLERQQVRLESCRIEPAPAAGIVSVTATFVRSLH